MSNSKQSPRPNVNNETKKNELKRGFKIAHLNVRSLVKNIDQLRIYLQDQQFDVISINETMLDNTVADHEISIRGYDIIRKDRNRNGGGVAIYIRSVINYKERHDLQDDNLETITVEISKPKSKPFLINTWYRPPRVPSAVFANFEECVKKMDMENKEIILVGDFNCDWDPEKNRISWQTDYLKDIANTYQFRQLITGHTRITESSAMLIDLAFTNKPESIVTSGIEHVGISDHSLIYIQRKISIPRKQPKITATRQYKNYQVAALKMT